MEDSASLRESNEQLRRAVEELSVLNELARTIGGSSDTDQVVRSIVRRSLEAVGAEQGVVTLAPVEEGLTMQTMLRTRVTQSDEGADTFHFNQSLLGWMQLNMRPLQIDDVSTDDRFRGVRWDPNVRSLLCVPMAVRSRLVAVLTVYNKRGDGNFTPEDKRLLSIIASQSAQVVENARLREQEMELDKFRRELELASVIQKNLLPRNPPAIAGYDVAGATRQAQMVGGDFFDFVDRPDGAWLITLGDVVGKGMPASLLMSNVLAILRTLALANTPSDAAMRVASSLLYKSTDVDKYVTLVQVALDPQMHTLSYVNAGHTCPLLVGADGTTQTLGHRELMLGLTDAFAFTRAEAHMSVGDTLVLYSDGINETTDPSGAEFGVERIAAVVTGLRGLPAAEIVEGLVQSVHEHAAGGLQQDDMTVVVAKRC